MNQPRKGRLFPRIGHIISSFTTRSDIPTMATKEVVKKVSVAKVCTNCATPEGSGGATKLSECSGVV